MRKTVRKALTGLLFLTLVLCAVLFAGAQETSSGEGAPDEPVLSGFLPGDVDLNGSVDAGDARIVLRTAISLENIPPERLPYADMHRDGSINASDARLALRAAVKLDKTGDAHLYDVTVTENATCTKTGRLQFKCSLCEDSGEIVIPKNAHRFGEAKITAATCQKTGLSVRVCVDCGIQSTVVLPKIGHKWVDATAKQPKHCSMCGLIVPGWAKADGKLYYYESSGELAKGKKILEGLVYIFDKNGVLTSSPGGMQPKVAVLGDSIVVSIANSSAAPEFDFYGKVGLNAKNIFTKSISGSSRKVIDEIVGRNYDIIVLLIGINDTSGSISTWETSYRDLIRGVHTRVPDAVVMAHAILPINEAKAKSAGYTVTMSSIKSRNAVIKTVAGEENAVYIDASQVIGTQNGQLPASSSGDGIHFAGSLCRAWHTWMLQQIAGLKG